MVKRIPDPTNVFCDNCRGRSNSKCPTHCEEGDLIDDEEENKNDSN